MLAPPLNQHFGFLQRVKDLHVEGCYSARKFDPSQLSGIKELEC